MTTTPIHNLTDVWADGATTFNAIKMNVTDTASAAASKLFLLQVDGTDVFTVDKSGAFQDSLFAIANNADRTKKVQFQVSGVTTGTTRTLTVPDFDGTIATLAGTEAFTNKTIDSANNTLTLDLSEGTLTGTLAEFNTALSDGSFASLNGPEVLTNKTIDLTSNTLVGSKAEFNTALESDTFLMASDLLDEDDMVSDSATAPASQQSVKAYVDAEAAKQVRELTNLSAMTALTKATLTTGDIVWLKGYASVGDLGGGHFRYDSASSATAVAGLVVATDEGGNGRWFRIIEDGVIYPEYCGAAGDDSTDDETAFTAARDYARDNSLVLKGLPGSIYYLAATSPSAITTVGTYKWRNIKLRSNITTSTRFMYYKGPNPTDTLTLTADVSIGATSVTVASGGGAYSAGDLVIIYEATDYHGSSDATAYGKKSFYATVASASATTIALNEAIPRSFLSANSPTISICAKTMVIDWEDVVTYTTSAPTGSIGVRFENAVVKMKGCHAYEFNDTCYEVVICYEPDIIDCRADDAKASGTGYGFNIGGCYNASLHNIHGDNCRHVVAIGYGPSGTTGSAWDRVLGQGGIASGVTGERCVGAPVDAHPGHVGFVYQNVDASVLSSASEAGAVIQATNIDVDGLRIRGGSGALVNIQHSGVPADEPANVINLSRLDGSQSDCTKCVVVQPLDIDNQTNIQVNVFGASGHYTQYAFHLTATSNSVSTEGGNMTMNVWGANVSSDLSTVFVDCRTFRCKGEINLYGTDLHCKNTGTGEACAYAQTANGLLDYDPSIALTLSATSGATVTATAASAIFRDEHMYDLISEDTSGSGVGQIVEVQSPTVAIIDTTVSGGAAFSGTSISSGNWSIDAADKGTLANGGAGGRINWYSGNGIRDYVSGSVQLRAENGDVVLGSEVRIRGESTFKSNSGVGDVFRAAAPAIATS